MNENQITFLMVMACFSLGASVGVLILMGMPQEETLQPYMTCEFFSEDNEQWFHCTEPGEPVGAGEFPALPDKELEIVCTQDYEPVDCWR